MIAYIENQINALALNKESSRIVIGGRSVLKVFNVSDYELLEDINLRANKQNQSLDNSTLDVAWSPHDADLIASGASNGSVHLFNVSASNTSRNKKFKKYQSHARAVNRVNFSPHDRNVIITGSQDATVRTFDMRVKDGLTATFKVSTSADSIRDVQFSPILTQLFASADDGGNIRIWDPRNPDRPTKNITAHNGPVLSIDFHPVTKLWLASGGRDKSIVVRDIDSEGELHSGRRRKPEFTVQTIQAVNRVRWRPGFDYQYHLASSSLVMDHSVYVWDVRRPYIPFATFQAHNDTVTGIAWCDDENFFSCGKDGVLRKHNFNSDAQRPIEYANPVGLAVAPDGEVFLATEDKKPPKPTSMSNRAIGYLFNRSEAERDNKKMSDLFKCPFQAVQWVIRSTSSKSALSMENFNYLARHYRLSGLCAPKLCELNAQVCEDVDERFIARLWLMLKVVLDEKTTSEMVNKFALVKQNMDDRLNQTEDEGSELTLGESLNTTAASVISASKHHEANQLEDEKDGVTDRKLDKATSGVHSSSGRHHHHRKSVAKLGSVSAPSHHSTTGSDGNATPASVAVGDFFFGASELDAVNVSSNEFDSLLGYNNWKLEREAFEPKVELQSAVGVSTNVNQSTTGTNEQTTTEAGGVSSLSIRRPPRLHLLPGSFTNAKLHLFTASPTATTSGGGGGGTLNTNVSSTTTQPKDVMWQLYKPVVRRALWQLAETGNVQSAVSMVIVLGTKVAELIDTSTHVRWFAAYIDLLDQFELYAVSARIIHLCTVQSVRAMSNQGTQVTLSCPNPSCGKLIPVGRRTASCHHCKQTLTICAICQDLVRGLWVSCQICCHGGHLMHMRQWFRDYSTCPAGCTHQCRMQFA